MEIRGSTLVIAEQGPSTNATGSTPLAGLTDGEDGRLYGVAGIGGANGYGTLFALDPVAGTVTVLHHFAAATSGSRPTGELLLAADSKLYGTTSAGGATGTSPQLGSAFSIARDGTGFATLVTFDGTHGSSPTGRLLQLDATTFVGVAPGSGNCGQGTIYQLSLTGAKVEGNTRCGSKKNNEEAGEPLRVARGGAWDTSDPRELRSAHRYTLTPGTELDSLGFRCVIDLGE